MSQVMIDYAINTVLPTIGEMAHQDKITDKLNTKGYAMVLRKGVITALPIPDALHPEAFTVAQRQTLLIPSETQLEGRHEVVTILTWLSNEEALSVYAESTDFLYRLMRDLKDAFAILDPDNSIHEKRA